MRTLLCTAVILPLFAGCVKTPDQAVAPIEADAVQSETLTIVTFNIRNGKADDGPNRWDNRKELASDLLAEYKADIIGLQEAYGFQFDQISRNLQDWDAVFTGRDDGRRGGEACPIFYRRDRFERLDWGTFWFSDTPDVPGSRHWGNNYTRICTWVYLRERHTGKTLHIYNLHLDHESQISREKSAQMLIDRIDRQPKKDFYIVLGDFNSDIHNPAMQSLLKGNLRIDTWQAVHGLAEPAGTYHAFSGTAKGGKIDFILVPQGTEVFEADIDQRSFDGRYPSDHFPVFARVVLPPGD